MLKKPQTELSRIYTLPVSVTIHSLFDCSGKDKNKIKTSQWEYIKLTQAKIKKMR